MLIEKKFHFYAAHRNETLFDKCRNVHGHVYRVTCSFKVQRDILNPDISTLFSQFDAVGHMLQNEFDHSMLVNKTDPVAKAVFEATGGYQKMVIFERPTSVENLCFELWKRITAMEFNLHELRIQETESSTVVYNQQDYEEDQKLFNAGPSPFCECTFGPNGKCVVCGRTEFEYKLAKKRAKNAEQATDREERQ